MPRISTSAFKGLYPSISPTLLPEGGAQTAIDCDLSSGSIKPYKQNSPVSSPNTTQAVKSIYNYTDKNGAKSWLWFENIVSVERAPIANDTTSRIYYTGDDYPKATDSDRLLSFPTHYRLGVPRPVTAPVASIVGAGSNPVDRVYVVTYVTAWGEESAPSDASGIVAVGAGGSVSLTIPNSSNSTDHNPVTKVYIYRTVTGNSDTAFQFVAEFPHGTTSYTDSTDDADLPGDLLVTQDYEEPPADLFGLQTMYNGCMVAFRDYEVCLSEPYQPHSWPSKYRYASKDRIIGGGVFGNRVIVLTNRTPFMLVGSDPDSMMPSNFTQVIPCVSAAGIVPMSDGVVFPAPDGLWFIGQGGVRNLTTELYTPDDWALVKPEEFAASQWDGKYIAFTSEKGFIFDLEKPDRHSLIGSPGTAAFIDADTKALYFNDHQNSSNRIYKFNASVINNVFQWKSKEYYNTERVALSAGRVYAKENGTTQADIDAAQALFDAVSAANAAIFANGNLNHGINQGYINEFSINGSDMLDLPTVPPDNVVHFKLWADKKLVYQGDVVSQEIFRMPIEYRANVFEFEVSSPMQVVTVEMASSARELRA